MKKIVVIVGLFFITLTSCSSRKYLERPEDTNLLCWITERVEKETLKKCTFLPGGFGSRCYLDNRYEVTYDEFGKEVEPPIHVTYTLSGYPDAKDASAVTFISITDPTIYVYGLTMNSKEEDISSVMKAHHFKEKEIESGCKEYVKNNVSFYFSSSYIHISAATTNKHHIVY